MKGFGLGPSEDLFAAKQLLKSADIALFLRNPHITDTVSPLSAGGPHDFYSNGEHWWPNPDTPNGLPYVRRDGKTNPGSFLGHRSALRRMRFMATSAAAAFRLTGRIDYARKAASCLREFFLEPETKMNPHLSFAQAVPGVTTGRGIGLTDTLFLADVPMAISAVRRYMRREDYNGFVAWFSNYLSWMNTHPNGIDERERPNSHSLSWFAQAASFAHFTGNEEMLRFCRDRFKTTLLGQMAPDGSFPRELARSRPYSYSCFALDALCDVALFASTPDDDLWAFSLPDGRSLWQGFQFLLPFLEDKAKWPYTKDVSHFEAYPMPMPFLVFCGVKFHERRALRLWRSMGTPPVDVEIRRNVSIRCPYLFFDEDYA